MERVIDQVERKIHNLTEFLLKRRQSDGTINSEISISALAEYFNLGKEATLKMLRSYYTYSKGKMFPRGRGFKPTEAIFLREYRYQNSLTSKRDRERNGVESIGNYLIVSNSKNGEILVKERSECKSHHLILAICRTPQSATKRWKELMDEKVGAKKMSA
jgi:hypothetical protein